MRQFTRGQWALAFFAVPKAFRRHDAGPLDLEPIRRSDARGSADLLADQHLCDYAGRNRHEQVVWASLDPVIAARRSAQPMTAPVVDNVMMAAVLRRQTAATMPVVIRTSAALVAH